MDEQFNHNYDDYSDTVLYDVFYEAGTRLGGSLVAAKAKAEALANVELAEKFFEQLIKTDQERYAVAARDKQGQIAAIKRWEQQREIYEKHCAKLDALLAQSHATSAASLDLSQSDIDQIWDHQIKPVQFHGSASHDCPVMVLLGGQPGAGKTRVSQLVLESIFTGENITRIVGDDMRRYHPGYRSVLRDNPLNMTKVTGAAAGQWVNLSAEHALHNQFPMLVEGTWRNLSVPTASSTRGKECGYDVVGVVVAVQPAISRLSTLERYYRDIDQGIQARWTPPEVHDEVVAKLVDNVRKLGDSPNFDRLIVVNRQAQILYDGNKDNADRGEKSSEQLLVAMGSDLSQTEAVDYLKSVSDLKKKHQIHTLDDKDACRVWEHVNSVDLPLIESRL